MPTRLTIQIERFVDEDQPGFVECSLMDAYGTGHLFVEKYPIVTTEELRSDSSYPRTGAIPCQIEHELGSPDGEKLVRVNTELPWHVESTTGAIQFVVHSDQVLIE